VDIDGYNEIMNLIYIAKKLYDMGKYELVKKSFDDELDYDTYYQGMYELIFNLFEHTDCRYYDYKCMDFIVVSDPAIVDFYILAGEYGKLNNLPDSDNPYIINATNKVNGLLHLGHCVDWILMGHTNPKRPFHSRIGIMITHDCGCTDLGVLAYRLLLVYEWYIEQCDELIKKITAGKSLPGQTKQEKANYTEREAAA
jgi:hypothetical protein